MLRPAVWYKLDDVSEMRTASTVGTITLIMKKGKYYLSTHHNIPEDNSLHTHRRENMIYQLLNYFYKLSITTPDNNCVHIQFRAHVLACAFNHAQSSNPFVVRGSSSFCTCIHNHSNFRHPPPPIQ